MARVINKDERALRRNEILDSAQQFILTRGYEQMTIQHLLDDLHISKGAFYHYFNSKKELLDALVERSQTQVEAMLQPYVDDPSLPALAKMERIFDSAARWKTAQKSLLMAFLRSWSLDENALVRQKQTAAGFRWLTPVLADIIRQGIREGVMDTPYPEQAGSMAITLMMNLGDVVGEILLSLNADSGDEARAVCLKQMIEATEACTYAVERILSVQKGSIRLFSPQLFEVWVQK